MEKLRVEVFRHQAWGDCTNNGVSSRHNEMLLFWDCKREDAIAYCDDNGINIDGCLWLKPRDLWGHDHSVAVPLIHETNMVGPMMGGNFVYTCDSRMPKIEGWLHAPIAVHDRYETQEDYNSNFD